MQRKSRVTNQDVRQYFNSFSEALKHQTEIIETVRTKIRELRTEQKLLRTHKQLFFPRSSSSLVVARPAFLAAAIAVAIKMPLCIFLVIFSCKSFTFYFSQSDSVAKITAHMQQTIDRRGLQQPPYADSNILQRYIQVLYIICNIHSAGDYTINYPSTVISRTVSHL